MSADAGPGRVVMEALLRARGQASGLEVTQATFLLCHVRDRMLARIDFFTTLEDALAAAR